LVDKSLNDLFFRYLNNSINWNSDFVVDNIINIDWSLNNLLNVLVINLSIKYLSITVRLKLILININYLLSEDNILSLYIIRYLNNSFIFLIYINLILYWYFHNLLNWYFNHLLYRNFNDLLDWLLNYYFNDFLSFNGSLNWNIYYYIIEYFNFFFDRNWDFLSHFDDLLFLNYFDFLSSGDCFSLYLTSSSRL